MTKEFKNLNELTDSKGWIPGLSDDEFLNQKIAVATLFSINVGDDLVDMLPTLLRFGDTTDINHTFDRLETLGLITITGVMKFQMIGKGKAVLEEIAFDKN